MPQLTRTHAPDGVKPSEAIELINSLVYKPGWTIEARSFEERFEGAVRVKMTMPALDSSYPPDYTKQIPLLRNDFVIVCGDCPTPEHVIRKLLAMILKFEEHEAREFLRLGEEHGYVAPFHPHTIRGQHEWSRLGRYSDLSATEQMITRDLTFGRV